MCPKARMWKKNDAQIEATWESNKSLLSKIMPSVLILVEMGTWSPATLIESHFAESHYAESHFADSHFAESHFAESHFAECRL